MEVDIEELERVLLYIKKINKQKLDDITWTLRGVVHPIPKDHIEEWEFTGLNNVDFARMNLLDLE